MPNSVSKKQYRYVMSLLQRKGAMADKVKGTKLKKALDKFLDSKELKAAGCLVLSKDSQILLGKRIDNGLWANPGGSVEPGEKIEDAALRELQEESGIIGSNPTLLISGKYNGYEGHCFLVETFRGKLKSNGELADLKWFHPCDIPWDFLTPYTYDAIKILITNKLQKSNNISWMLAEEELKKNIIRSGNAPGSTVYELTHGDALKLVGTGTFRFLRESVEGMTDESFREIPIDTCTLYIRKHTNDVYSGRIEDGHKQIHQFTNKSLPAVAAELMSVFEWYSPEDEQQLEDADIPDDAIEGGLSALMDNYKRNNIVNIYQEMETIRQEIRNGNAVDLQQVEQKVMKLFDKLEENVLNVVDKHNQLNNDAGDAIDVLETKLLELQSKIDSLDKKPVTIDAYTDNNVNDRRVYQEYYSYLTRPQVHIAPNGHIKISFDPDWTILDRQNFLQDLKAKAIPKEGV